MSGEIVTSNCWESSTDVYPIARNQDLIAACPWVVVDAKMQFVCLCATEENAKLIMQVLNAALDIRDGHGMDWRARAEAAKAHCAALREALDIITEENIERWADIGPCPCYQDAPGDECTCSEEARRLGPRDKILEAKKLHAGRELLKELVVLRELRDAAVNYRDVDSVEGWSESGIDEALAEAEKYK